MTAIIVIHMIICFLLIGIIMIQAGRGGGLVESFSSVESMFGTKTNAFLTKATTVLSILFFVTCLSLALLSARQSRSLLKDYKAQPQGTAAPAADNQAAADAVAAAAAQTAKAQGENATPQQK